MQQSTKALPVLGNLTEMVGTAISIITDLQYGISNANQGWVWHTSNKHAVNNYSNKKIVQLWIAQLKSIICEGIKHENYLVVKSFSH